MKRISIVFISLLFSAATFAEDGYRFTSVKENPITSIKNQASSGTCWCFSSIAFLESELLRAGKGEYDLSEMYIVRRNYADKADKYARMNGHLNFAQGGSFADAIGMLDEYGLLPETEMPGLNYGETRHNHTELEAVLSAYVKALVGNKKLTTAWRDGFNGILDAYLGHAPEQFGYAGKSYTPQQFASALGLSSGNYISLTSFTHHPFYGKFALEIPDNWRWAESTNLPLDELMQVIDHALENGYTIAWAADVSEAGFSRTGLAAIPDVQDTLNIGADQAHWLGLKQSAKDEALRKRVEAAPVSEPQITQEMRQKAFDNYETTDDHGMQIFGIAKDQNGKKYYMVKNSWGETGNYKGMWYVTEAFVQYKTIGVVVNKNAVPSAIGRKIGLTK
ncbi:MAG: C1 family peptidase [Prevotella sp.]|jgi:aminopeptidase C|nr:C1 family peptidase [Prevotella sp.]